MTLTRRRRTLSGQLLSISHYPQILLYFLLQAARRRFSDHTCAEAGTWFNVTQQTDSLHILVFLLPNWLLASASLLQGSLALRGAE